MATDYVGVDTTGMYRQSSGGQPFVSLLWGDEVATIQADGGRTQVRARGVTGWVRTTDLGGQALLEVYFVDVGQGDGVLVVTPGRRHLLIDGGYRRAYQPTGKNAADFVDWKFVEDYGRAGIHLDAMLASHCDADHYGGLSDLLDPGQRGGFQLDATGVTVDAFYHAGVSWWVDPRPNRSRWLGPTAPTADGGEVLTQLLEGGAAIDQAIRENAQPKLQGEWAEFMRRIRRTKRASGQPTRVQRLDSSDVHLPGFAPTDGDVVVRVLGPITSDAADGTRGLTRLGPDSQNTNGHSLLLRLDYGRTRVLLTGDLNRRSQRFILDELAGNRQELAADVAKACHHGSEDISYEFLQAVSPAATVISSGDNEGHGHPRPSIVAASALAGHVSLRGNDELSTPLIYSTEISQSVSYGTPTTLDVPIQGSNTPQRIDDGQLDDSQVTYLERRAGDLNPRTRARPMKDTKIVAGIIYGLVNVRTDGTRILCATRNENNHGWEIESFISRF